MTGTEREDFAKINLLHVSTEDLFLELEHRLIKHAQIHSSGGTFVGDSSGAISRLRESFRNYVNTSREYQNHEEAVNKILDSTGSQSIRKMIDGAAGS